MEYTLYFNSDTSTATVVAEGDSFSGAGSVEVGTFEYDPVVNTNRVLYHYVRDILNRTHKEDPEETAKFPYNITDMARLQIVVSDSVVVVLPGSITATPATVSLEVAGTQQLTVEFTPANTANKAVTFSSDGEDIATVSETGLVTGVEAGTATITITSEEDSNVTTIVEVTVT